MTAFVHRETLSAAWVGAMEHLVGAPKGKDHHVAVAFDRVDNSKVRTDIDDVLNAERKGGAKGPWDTQTTANTVFPEGFYHPHLGDTAAPRLYELHRRAMKAQKRIKPSNQGHSYFDRMVAYPLGDGEPFNQLDMHIKRLRRGIARGNALSSAYELGLSEPEADVRIQAPGVDRSIMSFPCLSHISLTYTEGRINLVATYRNQNLVLRGYGNYLGLARLAAFVANEVGAQPGQVLCVATHADANFDGRPGKTAVRQLVARCRTILDGESA